MNRMWPSTVPGDPGGSDAGGAAAGRRDREGGGGRDGRGARAGDGIAAEPEYLDVTIPAGAEYVQAVPEGHAALAYVFEGDGVFGGEGGQVVPSTRMVVFGDGDRVAARAAGKKPFRFLLLSGRPLREPISRYGPFVMNTKEEIEQALEDLRKGTFIRR